MTIYASLHPFSRRRALQRITMTVSILLLALFTSTACAQQPVQPSDKPDAVIKQLRTFEQQLIPAFERARLATVAVKFPNMNGTGSGVIVSPDGIVMTAGHCVMNPGQKVRLIMHDGRELRAEGLGLEKMRDCGLFQIAPEQLKDLPDLPYAEMGWSSLLKPNEPVFSVAHGGGYDALRGAYLRFGRIVAPVSDYNGFIHNTCLMEPGDSGGPLFNMDGQVVGIRTQVRIDLDKNFDVPVDLYRYYWKELNRRKEFQWYAAHTAPGFGINFEKSSISSFANLIGLSSGGIKTSSVTDDGWAAKNGFQPGDYIETWNGETVSSIPSLHARMIHAFSVAATADIDIKRDRKSQTLTLDFSTMKESPAYLDAIQPDRSATLAGRPNELLAELTEQMSSLEQQLDDYTAIARVGSNRVPVTLFFSEGKASTRWAVGSSSLLRREDVELRFESGDVIAGKIAARSDDCGLALINLSESVKRPPHTAPIASNLSIGQFLISASPFDDGHISVKSTERFSTLGPGRLGVKAKVDADRFIIESIDANSAAANAELKVNDQLVSLNGSGISSTEDAIRILDKTQPGQQVSAIIKRDDEEMNVSISLKPGPLKQSAPWLHAAAQFAGGVSKAARFRDVVIHDGPVLRRRCGGPVFDLNGHFVGVNVARASRTRTYLIPATTVASFVKASRPAAD